MTRETRLVGAAALVGLLALAASSARAQRKEPLPKELEGVGVTEKLGHAPPMDTPFRDEHGNAVRFGDFFRAGVPTLLTLNYSNCPMLCSIQLTGLVQAMRDVDWTLGEKFQAITISMDPTEPPERARQSHDRYVGEYGRPAAAAGWHFLVGPESSVRAVADAVGFGYRYDAETKQYVHSPVAMLLDPSGKVARYLYGIQVPPSTLRLSLREAAAGKEVSAVDQLVLYCFHYDADRGRYAPTARNIVRLGGGLTLGFLGLGVALLFRRERRGKTAAGAR